MDKLAETLGIFTAALVLAILYALLMALPTMWLWNWALVPAVDGINSIAFWQALGLNFLFSILFKSTGKTSKNDK